MNRQKKAEGESLTGRKKEEEMLTILFLIFLFGIFGKLFFFGVVAMFGMDR